MGAGVGGADGCRPSPSGRGAVQALRGVDHGPAGAPAAGRRAAGAPRRRPGRARRRVHHRDVGAGVPLARRPPDRPHRRLRAALPEPDRRRRPPAHRGRARVSARLERDGRCQGGAVRRRILGGVGRQPAGGRCRRDGVDGSLRPGAGDRCHVPRRHASRPASTGRRSRTSCGRTASRCATSRRASASRRSADGSPPVRAATTPPTTRTSTTSSSRCGCSRRRVGGRAAACPGSGAGPSPDRMVIGSEGILGVITEAWMRIQPRPTFRATAGIVFPTWESGAEAVRQIVQAKLWPAQLPHPRPGRSGAGGRPRRGAVAGDRQLRVGRPLAAPRHRARRRHRPRAPAG